MGSAWEGRCLRLKNSAVFAFSLLCLVKHSDATMRYVSKDKGPCTNLNWECKSQGKECWVCPTGKAVCVNQGQWRGSNPDGCLANGGSGPQQGGRSSGRSPSNSGRSSGRSPSSSGGSRSSSRGSRSSSSRGQGTGKIQMEILGQTTKEVLVMEMETAT